MTYTKSPQRTLREEKEGESSGIVSTSMYHHLQQVVHTLVDNGQGGGYAGIDHDQYPQNNQDLLITGLSRDQRQQKLHLFFLLLTNPPWA